MKFKCEKGSKNYYYEFLYVNTYYNKFMNNKKLRAKNMMNHFISILLLSIVFCSLFIVNICFDSVDIFDYIFLGFFGSYILLISLTMLRYRKGCKLYLNNKTENTIIIDEEGITSSSNKYDLLIKWDNISFILVNKYSICLMPKTLPNINLSIPVEYKDKIIKGLQKYNKEELLLDNSLLY